MVQRKCIVCNSPIREGIPSSYCGNVCYCKDLNIHFGTEEYEINRQYYLRKNQELDKLKDEKYNQALLESGKLYIDHPEEVAHVEVKDGNVELKAPLIDELNDEPAKGAPLGWGDQTWRPTVMDEIQARIFGFPVMTAPFLKSSNIHKKFADCIQKEEPVFNKSGSKYLRRIITTPEGKVDVYAVLLAFNVTCPARQHAIKKLLCTGIRNKGSVLQDLQEARDAVDRAIQLFSTED